MCQDGLRTRKLCQSPIPNQLNWCILIELNLFEPKTEYYAEIMFWNRMRTIKIHAKNCWNYLSYIGIGSLDNFDKIVMKWNIEKCNYNENHHQSKRLRWKELLETYWTDFKVQQRLQVQRKLLKSVKELLF